MSGPGLRGRFEAPADANTFDFGSTRSFDALDPGEPIHPPRERGSSMLGASLVLLVLFGGGWAAMQAPADWLAALGERVAALSELVRDTGATAPVATISMETSSIAQGAIAAFDAVPGPPAQAVDAPVPPDAEIVETGAIGEPDGPASDQDNPGQPQPLPPVRVDPADPYQKRAAAAGLHPDLSRALLARLTATDYRNARYAVETAIASSGNEDAFVWPRQRKPEQALFRVHFVKGAGPECRRYVVTVEKDRWTTTAPAMERCGPLSAQRNKVSGGAGSVSGR